MLLTKYNHFPQYFHPISHPQSVILHFHPSRAHYTKAISTFISFHEPSFLSFLGASSSFSDRLCSDFVGDFLRLRQWSSAAAFSSNMVHKKKLIQKEPAEQGFGNIRVSARNLSQTSLGSVIFGCKHNTQKECILKKLFGLPSFHYAYVRNVRPGMPLFLFNYIDRKLHGIFEAESEGRMNINQYAWTFDGDDVTQFPAQVKMRIRERCQPLTEDEFKPVIAKNYYGPLHFWFELDKTQTQNMIALFMKSSINKMPQSKSRPVNSKLLVPSGLQPTSSLESCETTLHHSNEGQASGSRQNKGLTDSLPTKSWSSLFKQLSESKPSKEQETAPLSNWSDHESENAIVVCPSRAGMDWEAIYDEENASHEDQKHGSLANIGGVQLDDELEPSFEEEHSDVQETKTLYSKGDSIISDDCAKATSENSSHQSNMETGSSSKINDWDDISVPDKGEVNSEAEPETPESLSDAAVDFSSLTEEVILNMTLSELRIVALKLMQDQRNHSLKRDKVESNAESVVLKENLMMHESSLFHSVRQHNSILLVGGFDGSLFLPSLDSFVPSVDNIRPLKSMDNARAYATPVQLNNELYVLGGGDGKLWYDTVQSYSLDKDCWVSCPSLSKKKGNLVAIGLGGKIFAMGGGNGTDCLKDVEILDLGSGKWISSTSMLQKRFAAAAAEVRGMLYVVGGYDGEHYLSSVEGYDPREHSWGRLQRMNTRRGCHSVTVLNEKLYAIGGHDGFGMISSVEVYDPRFGSWMMAEPMNTSRGYFGAVAIAGSIYSIGGITNGGEILASVECYSEDNGWQLTNSKSVGKRSAFGAMAVAM